MEEFEIALIDRVSCGADVVTARFTRPEGYRFVAGQYALFGLETATGYERKPFTLAGAPGDEWIEITTRPSPSEFKKALMTLGPGGAVRVSAPAGRLTLPGDARRVVFLVGGVGITPARSIARDAMQRGTGLEAVVFYGCRDAGCIPYRAELESYSSAGIEMVIVLERADDDWNGERGFVTADVVRRHHVGSPDAWIVSGPPAMVEAMIMVLDDLGVPGEMRMIERFGTQR